MLSLQDLFEIMLDIERMEKLEFGGPKGKLYSEHAAQMYSEFSNHCQALQHSENSPLDLNSQVNIFLLALLLLIKIAANNYCIDHVQHKCLSALNLHWLQKEVQLNSSL